MSNDQPTDDTLAAFYEVEANRTPIGPGYRRKNPVVTRYPPVRFTPETIEAVRPLAREDHTTVSTWIRRVVDIEVARRTGVEVADLRPSPAPERGPRPQEPRP